MSEVIGKQLSLRYTHNNWFLFIKLKLKPNFFKINFFYILMSFYGVKNKILKIKKYIILIYF
jgi:hypothetical protein